MAEQPAHQMEVKQTDESTMHLEPEGKDESILVGMLFEKATQLYPDWKMGDRTDLAMSMLAVVKQWAHDLSLTSESHRMVELPYPRVIRDAGTDSE